MPLPAKRTIILQLLNEAEKAGSPQDREQLIDRAIEIVGTCGNTALATHTYTTRARMYFDTGRYQECLQDIERAKKVAGEKKNYAISFLYGCALLYTGAYSDAIVQLNHAVNIAQTERSLAKEGAAMESLGNTYVTLGSYEQGFRYLRRAEEIFRTNKLIDNHASILHNLAMAYAQYGDMNMHYECLMSSIGLMEQSESKPGVLAVSLNSIAAYHLTNNDLERVIEYAQRSIILARKSGNHNRRAEAQLNYAIALCRTGKASKAVALSKDALKIFSLAGHRRFECRALITLAFSQYLCGKRRATRAALIRAATLAGSIGARADSIEAYDALYQICTEENDLSNALLYQRLYFQTQLEIAENDAKQKMEYQRVVLNAEESIREIESQKENARLLQEQIEQKQRELHQSAFTLAKQGELLTTLRDSLLTAMGNTPRQTQRVVREMLETVERFGKQFDPWEHFLLQFNALHSDFLQRISKQFPSLSSTELRMCALLRMNMSTKDIANLLTISTRTVENQRHNLRKKIQLHPDVPLNTWLAML